MKKENKIAIGSELGREAYEASVMEGMKGRSGAYTRTGAPGIAHEMMANDRQNLKNLWENPGAKTRPTKSPTAQQVDAVTIDRNGKVSDRFQYKDVTSQSGMSKLLHQVEDGKYQQTQLKGTEETTELFNEAAEKLGISKRMTSTGISHDTTRRIGDKFTGQTPALTSIGDAVKCSAKTAGAITAGLSIVESVAEGDSFEECVGKTTAKCAESMVTSAVAAGAGELAFAAAAPLFAATAIPIAGPVIAAGAAAVAAGSAAGNASDGVFDDIGRGVGEIAGVFGDIVDDFFYSVGTLFGLLF